VLDFGLAKLIQKRDDAALTDTGQMLGTPIYMAPEQIRGRADLDGRADIYSVGVILYEMLTAKTPFSTRSTGDVLVAKMIEKPDRPSRYATIPGPLEKIVLRAIDAIPDRRPANAQELAAALEFYTADSAAMSATGQIALPARNRWMYMALGGVAVAAIALAVFFLVRGGDEPAADPAGHAERAAPLPPAAEDALAPAAAAADLADASPEAPADVIPAAAVEPPAPAPTGKTDRSRKKRRGDDKRSPGRLYDAPTDSLRLPK
jgi:hypothetical protein